MANQDTTGTGNRRLIMGLLTALALTACDQGEQPTVQDQREARPASPARVETPVQRQDPPQNQPSANMHNSINYIEFPMVDTAATKAFYRAAFGWGFTDWGADYVSFSAAGVNGGFTRVAGPITPQSTPLVVLYVRNLEASLDAVTKAGGQIVRPIYTFPGGRRFHFSDPNGNELAVWSR